MSRYGTRTTLNLDLSDDLHPVSLLFLSAVEDASNPSLISLRTASPRLLILLANIQSSMAPINSGSIQVISLAVFFPVDIGHTLSNFGLTCKPKMAIL